MARLTAPVAAWAVCVAVIAAADARDPQQQQPTFRGGVEIFHLDVSVLDKDRRPVKGLTAADFTILEDGRPQKIVALSAVDLPPAMPPPATWTHDVTPDVTSNQSDGRRLFVMVLDDASAPKDIREVEAATFVKRIGHQVVDRLGPSDLMAVVFTADNRRPQNFTNDRAKLRAAIGRFSMLGGLSVPTAMLMSVDTLVSATEYLIEIPERRKTLLYIGTGVGVSIDDAAAPFDLTGGATVMSVANYASPMMREIHIRAVERMTAIFAAAERANVNIYSFDAAGLRTSKTFAVPSREFMQIISSNTGGRAVINTNDFGPGVEQLFIENASYYLVGYESTSPEKAAARWRRLQVRVNRPDVEVRSRTRHYTEGPPGPRRGDKVVVVAPPGTTPALAGLLPEADVSLRASLAPFAIPGRTDVAAVTAVLAIEPSPALKAMGAIHDLDLEISAFDPEGRPRGSIRHEARAPLDDVRVDGALAELISRMDLKPGAYELRLALHDLRSHASGSVYVDVEVPDFARAPVSLSGVLLASTAAPRSAPRDALAALVPIQPTARRSFTAAERVTSFARVYQGGGARQPVTPVTIDVQIQDAQGAAVFESREAFAPDRFAVNRAADIRVDLPLARLRPGPYLLTIAARAGDRAPVRRQIQFERR